MSAGVLVPIALFAAVAAVIIVPQYLKSQERARLHDTLRSAFDKGQPVPPEIVEALTTDRHLPTAPSDRSARDLRVGIVWLSVGLGFMAIGAAFYAMLYYHGGAVETMMSFVGLGAIPFFIGLAFLLLSFFGRGKSR